MASTFGNSVQKYYGNDEHQRQNAQAYARNN